MPLTSEIGDFNLKIEIEIHSEDGISHTTIENKVKETISQIGGKIIKEELE